jgi:oligopeptidase B
MSEPPRADRRPVTVARHGRTVVDEYAWLRDRDDPATLAYLRAENAWADAWFAPLGSLREQLFAELRARVVEDDDSVPVRHGPFWYRTRTETGREYPVWERWPSGDGTDPTPPPPDAVAVVLDENVEADGHDYFAVGAFSPSPTHRRLAWSLDVHGDERYELRVRALDTGVDGTDRIPRTAASVAWLDDDHLVYLVTDDAERPHQLWRHRVGTDPGDDVLVLTEDDERFWLDVERTRSGAYVVVSAESRTTSEVWLLSCASPTAAPLLVEPRRAGHEYTVDHWGRGPDGAGEDLLVVLTNDDGAEDFAVATVPAATPGRAHWRSLVGPVPGRRITGIDAFASHVVLSQWRDATPGLCVLWRDGRIDDVVTPEPLGSIELGPNPQFDGAVLRYEFESFTTPPTVVDLTVASGVHEVRKRTPVAGGYDASSYVTERVWADAGDGAAVPIDVVRHRDTPLDGTAPLVVYGYGAYEISLAPWFSHHRISLYDRGVVGAVVHPRGGGELGRRWYLDGKLRNKPNTFADVAACTDHLVAAGYGARDRVALWGGSAGGLLVGATVALDPGRYAAALAEVPFVDVVNTLSDPTLPLTINEWEEWGDPADPDDEAVLSSYAPYENVRPVPYPAMLVTGGWFDPRVGFHEPAKWVARLRATVPDRGADERRPILLLTELDAGHGGPSGRYAAWRDLARQLAFLLRTLAVA